MRIFVATITTETNTFAPAPTGLAAFAIEREGVGGDAMTRMWSDIFEPLAASDGHEVVRGLIADAPPGGLVVRAAYEALRDELLDDLRRALPVDAIVLPLHGAVVADGYDDCEGDLLERAHGIVGPGVPIGVLLDLHGHFTARMHRFADVTIAYREYPHTDIAERFADVWRLTIAAARGEIAPVTAVFDCRMVQRWRTTRQPMRSFVDRMKSLQRSTEGVLDISFGHGFVYGDVPEADARLWVVTDGDEAMASELAERLGRELIAIRHETAMPLMSLDAAIDRLRATEPAQPIVLADVADNAGGGASSDSTFVLRALLDQGIDRVAIGGFWDPGAVHVALKAGVGSTFEMRIGGKCGPASGDPVDLRVTVMTIADAGDAGVDTSLYGTTVRLRGDRDVDIVLISKRQQPYGTDLFTDLGIDLTRKRVIVVKSAQHFYAAFAPFASEVHYVETPGLLRSDFAAIPYRRRSLDYWPRIDDPWSAKGVS